MPSFYPRHIPASQLPLTPPEFVPNYNGNSGCGAMQYQQTHIGGRPMGMGRSNESSYDMTDRFNQAHILSAPPSVVYSQQGPYSTSATTNIPPVNARFENMGANVLPPMLGQGRQTSEVDARQRPVEDSRGRVEQPVKQEEKPVGGVSAKLDYDMEIMTDFVTEMAQGIVQTGRPMPQSFRKWVHQVLQATRLPSATILLSLYYLSVRMGMLSASGQFKASEVQIYRLLTIALLLGSKFLDDNTFINRSWSDVSGISVADLNILETEWLVAINFKLHCEPTEAQGFNSWLSHWEQYSAQAVARSSRQNRLSPIDTKVQQYTAPRPVQSSTSPYPSGFPTATAQDFVPKAQSHYSTHSQYNNSNNNWQNQRGTLDHSPASAPHTGPTTPEYYGAQGAWAAVEGYSRRTMFGFPPLAQTQPHTLAPLSQHVSYGQPAFTPPYSAGTWTGHGVHCNCMHCARHQTPFAITQTFRVQPIYA